jgi:hypothetical protein
MALLFLLLIFPALGTAADQKRPTMEEIRTRVEELKRDPAWKDWTPLERERRIFGIDSSRKLSIFPVRSNAGIGNGWVIAYGHMLPHPYVIERNGDKLIINGIQVRPSIILEREASKRPRIEVSQADKARFSREKQATDAICDLYRKMKGKVSDIEIRKEIFDAIDRSSDIYRNPYFVGTDTLQVELVATGVKTEIDLNVSNVSIKDMDALKKIKMEKIARNQDKLVFDIKEELHRGMTLVFASDGAIQHLPDIRAKVNQVMAIPGLSRVDRIERLKNEVFNHFASGEDVADNYDAHEWEVR